MSRDIFKVKYELFSQPTTGSVDTALQIIPIPDISMY